jgi:hypothetical protein
MRQEEDLRTKLERWLVIVMLSTLVIVVYVAYNRDHPSPPPRVVIASESSAPAPPVRIRTGFVPSPVSHETRFGYSLEQRQEIYAETQRALVLSTWAADREVPQLPLATPDFAKAEVERTKSHMKVCDTIRSRAYDAIAAKWRLSRDELGQIINEGTLSSFPQPKVSRSELDAFLGVAP